MTKLDWERARQRDLMRDTWDERHRNTHHPRRSFKPRPKQCAGTTKAGLPCRGKAKTGHDLCGPHLDQQAAGRAIGPNRAEGGQ